MALAGHPDHEKLVYAMVDFLLTSDRASARTVVNTVCHLPIWRQNKIERK